MNSAVIILFVALIASAVATPVNKCTNNVALPNSVTISNCDQQPCPLVRGTNVTLEVSFTAPDYLEVINTEVITKALGLELPYPLPEPDACKNLLNAKCPVEEGQKLTYLLVMPVSHAYPLISLGITVSLQDENKKSFTCFQVDCKVVNP